MHDIDIESLWRMFLVNCSDFCSVNVDYESELMKRVPPMCWIAGTQKYIAATNSTIDSITPEEVYVWMRKQARAYQQNCMDANDEWLRQNRDHLTGKRAKPADDDLLMVDGVFKKIPEAARC